MKGWIIRATLAALLLTGSGCLKASSAPRKIAPRALPADSAALLAAALRLARPAFSTQAEALRAGVYARPTPAQPTVAAATVPPLQPVVGSSSGGYVIQIAAFADLAAATRAASEVERRFPGHAVVIESVGTVYRVALAGWESATAAAAELPAVQRLYPDAWVRRRGIS